jgi:hypothetical protein
VADQDDVRRLALALPEVVEGDDGFGFGVRGKQFAWVWRERVVQGKPRVPRPDVLVVRVPGQAGKELLLGSDPDKFFTEPHYNGFPAVMVRLAAVDIPELTELLTEAWRCQAPRSVIRASGL